MTEQCYLAVDLGAESGRVIAGMFDGQSVSLKEVHRFPNGPVTIGGTLRWDVLRLWSEIQIGLGLAGEDYGDRLVSVGVDTWGVDYVLMTDKDELLGQPYNYRDARTEGLVAQTCARVSKEEIFAQTGLQFMELNTLYQLLAMQRDHAPLLQLANRFLMMPDFFHWCLCGSRVVEFTNATTSQCYSPTEKDWAFELLKKLELPTQIFPEVVPPGTKLGTLRTAVAQRTGLPRIDVVAPATHDTGSAVAAIPTDNTGQPNWAYISSGTWSLIGVEVQDAIITPQALQYNVTNEGGVGGTYRLLKNIMGLWLVQECRKSFDRLGHSLDYDKLVKLAEEAAPFRSLIDPDDHAFLNPADMPTAIRQWCEQHDQVQPETPGQLVRCALESLALRYRQVLVQLEELTGVKIEVMHIVGGGSQNALLNQFTANACQIPVLTGPIEATAIGNVLLQAYSHGSIGSLPELRQVVQASSTMDRYQPQEQAAWQAAFESFSQMIN